MGSRERVVIGLESRAVSAIFLLFLVKHEINCNKVSILPDHFENSKGHLYCDAALFVILTYRSNFQCLWLSVPLRA